MREAVFEGKRTFAVKEMSEPVPGEGEVTIKVHCCGICGSDLHTYVEGAQARYGHEFAGDIVEVGPGVKGWQAGDRVAAESVGSCGECLWCRRGEINLCQDFYAVWSGTAGAFATYTKSRADRLHRLPPEISYEEASLAEPAAVALHAVQLSSIRAGSTVAVLGLGPIGNLVAQLARASGAGTVYATEASKTRLELARKFADHVVDVGQVDPVEEILALTSGTGPDIVFECAGAVSTTQQALALARRGGSVILVGMCLHPMEMLIGNLVLRELTLKGSMCFHAGEYSKAMEMIKHGKIDVLSLVTARLPLDRINEAFELALSGDGGKILVFP
ncbi:MAG: zinc-binding dehydrogenase [Dehalococcoidia bacterium]|nr:zinc-binding dehydrogenase [Dehalococcoidia bacterium]